MEKRIKQIVAKVTNTFSKRGEYPELSLAREIYHPGAWELISSNAIGYLKIIRDLAHISEEDIATLREFEQRRGRRSYILNLIEQAGDKLDELAYTLLPYFDRDDENFKAALANLAYMMSNAQILKKKGIEPKDGNPLADQAIWGYTKIILPEAQMHFVVCHFIERLATVVFQEYDFVAKKDWLLNAMSELILLNAAKKGYPKDPIFSLWSTPKAEGGLGWIGQSSLKAMQSLTSVEG